MPFYYLSFCDPALPKGEQFLGNTVVEAADELDIPAAAARAGRNPGGEIAFVELFVTGPDDPELPPQARKYFERFVPRDEALAEPHYTQDEMDDEDVRTGTICAPCNVKN